MEPKPKILYLVTQAEWGGAQRYVFDLAASMRGWFETAVATGTKKEGDGLPAMLEETDVPVFEIKDLIRQLNPLKDVRAVFELRSLLKKIRPQILHLNSTKAGVLGAFAAIGLGIKVVYTVHGWVFLEPLPAWKRWFYLICEKIACRFRHATILLSQKEFGIARSNKLGCDVLEIIEHGIDAPEFLPKENAQKKLAGILRQQFNDNKIRIGTIANFYETKDIPNLVKALKNINNGYIAIVIGHGDRSKIESLIKKENLSGKIFLAGGIVDASNLLKAFDVFVLPSAKEGFPYVILEAMSAGLPIVATSVGAIPEMITDKKSGLLVPPKNPEALKAAIETIITDENLRASLGKEAEADFKLRFSKEKMIEKTKKVYQSLLYGFPQ